MLEDKPRKEKERIPELRPELLKKARKLQVL